MAKSKKSNKGKARAGVHELDPPKSMLPLRPFGDHAFTETRSKCTPPGDGHPYHETETAHGAYDTFDNGGFETLDTGTAIRTFVEGNGRKYRSSCIPQLYSHPQHPQPL